MKKLLGISACAVVLILNSCRSEPAHEIFDEPVNSGNVFLQHADTAKESARTPDSLSQDLTLENLPPIPPRK